MAAPDHPLHLMDPECGAVRFALPLLHLIDVISSQPSLCQEMVSCLSFRDACIESWLITLPHSSFRDPFLHVMLHLSDIPGADVEDAVRSIASSIPAFVLNAIIMEFPSWICPSEQDNGYISHLSSCVGSLFAITHAAPNHSVFSSPVSLCWLAAVLKTLIREIDCRAVKEMIIWTLGCLEHILPFSHYTVIGNLVESGLLKDVMTAVKKMTRTHIATTLISNFHRALEGIFSSLQGVAIFLPVLQPLRRYVRSVKTSQDLAVTGSIRFSTMRSWLLLKDTTTILGVIYERRHNLRIEGGRWNSTCTTNTPPHKDGNTVENVASQSTAQRHARRKAGLWTIEYVVSSPKGFALWILCFMKLSLLPKYSLRDEVDSKRKEFVEASNGQYSENDSILVFDYRYGFNTEADFRSKEAQEEVWNPADSYMVEVIARGIAQHRAERAVECQEPSRRDLAMLTSFLSVRLPSWRRILMVFHHFNNEAGVNGSFNGDSDDFRRMTIDSQVAHSRLNHNIQYSGDVGGMLAPLRRRRMGAIHDGQAWFGTRSATDVLAQYYSQKTKILTTRFNLSDEVFLSLPLSNRH
ncbi:hypothetical protein EDD85DRAFT_798926 [Armillaria nabsnona]|nr:hypothetical protein EDD85DRAFT_798926 [Armillaria nabsnona]